MGTARKRRTTTSRSASARPPAGHAEWLSGGGQMGDLIRAFDWSRTPIGPMESWSLSLRMMVRFLLANRFPMLLWWGPDYTSIYNDPYRPVLGTKHPWALGTPVRECWSEIWHILRPLIDTPFQGGPSTWNDDIFLEINRHGFVEETHFTIAYSPVPDETVESGIGGVLATVVEITEKVIAERRVVALRDLGARIGQAKTADEACAIACDTLAAAAKDIPFAVLYLIEDDGKTARLACTVGVEADTDIAPQTIDLHAASSKGWPIADALRTEAVQVVDGLKDRFDDVPRGPWSDPPSSGIVVSIPSGTPHRPVGLMMAGVSPRSRLDEYYLAFFELVRTQVAAAIANATAYETERERAEALAEIDRAKTAFFSNVSHEFRTPLTLILSPVEDLLAESDGPVASPPRERLEMIRRNGLRLQKLVNTLLDFSRIEAGRVQAAYEPVDLSSFTAELASNFHSACDRAGVELVIDCPPLSEPVWVDRDMWEKIVLNLISNAFKFTLEGRIQVSLRDSGDGVVLDLVDTGTGIPEAEMPKLFERFHRVEGARGRSQEGSGIGLALVRELVKLHGGDVRAESRLNEGSTFSVTLPFGNHHLPADRLNATTTLPSTTLSASSYVEEAFRWLPDSWDDTPAQTAEAMGAADLPPERPATGPRPRILIADDNSDMRQYLTRLLAERYDLTSALDGEAALERIRDERPDLVLTDVMMPKLDGFGLLHAIRSDPRTQDIPVIILSARAGEEARIEGLEAGADDYMVKPFGARELLARVQSQLQLAKLRHESRRSLIDSELRFRTMADTAPAMIWVTDADTRCSFLSRSWFEYTGQNEVEALGFGWFQAVHPDDAIVCERVFLDANGKHEPFKIEYRLRGRDGQYRWVIDSARPRFDGSGNFLGYIGSVIDVHEHKQVEQALRESEEALKESDRRKDEFLAMLAHELRNPLAPIRNAAQILERKGPPDPELRWAREVINRQVDQLSRLVDDLLDVSRITRGRIELRKQRVELRDIINDAVEASGPVIARSRHTLSVDMPSEPMPLDADPTRLAQILLNLLNNAAKYTEPGGDIRLDVSRDGKDVVIRVKDNGVGIAPDVMPLIFEMFAQADASIGRAQGGPGIGLTLVKRLVSMHGGQVHAHSDGPGKGSEFIVRLPLADRPGTVTQPAVTRENATPGAPLRILVVDDNRDAADSMAMFLGLTGHEVRTAHDGQAAVEVANAFKPGVVLLDIGLPKLNGYEAAQQMRQHGSNAVLIALTGWGQEEDRRRSREAGFDHHLTKPVVFDDLNKLLADVEKSDDTGKTPAA